jgi:hypothetical protein
VNEEMYSSVQTRQTCRYTKQSDAKKAFRFTHGFILFTVPQFASHNSINKLNNTKKKLNPKSGKKPGVL